MYIALWGESGGQSDSNMSDGHGGLEVIELRDGLLNNNYIMKLKKIHLNKATLL